MNDLDNVISKLKASPLFYLFLSSRELFHSNFWYWLSTINKTETIRLFDSSPLTPDNYTLKREHNQSSGEHKSKVDLLISYNNNSKIAIENKVKDFPRIEQLDRIKNSFSNEDVKFILTTLFWSDEIKFEGWSIKTYKEISDAIYPKLFTENEYFRYLIIDYKEFTSNLAKLSEILPISTVYNFTHAFNMEVFHKLNEIKLWEGYQKLRASHLVLKFEQQNVHGLNTFFSINNQKAKYKIGIQIEDNQFRKYVAGRKAGQFIENLSSQNLFFNDQFRGRGQKPYLNYGDHFKYQYSRVLEPLVFDELFSNINNEMSFVINNIDSIKANIPNI
jgi:hypothetical protein